MEIHQQNLDESSSNRKLSASPSKRTPKDLAELILVFEIPAVLLLLHGLAYLLDLPGAEVGNDYSGRQPIAFAFFGILATGGLLVPLILGCWLSATLNSNVWIFGLVVGISYAIASLAWWMLIVMGGMARFV